MPGLPDDRFAHSVILICAHSDEGAMGLMINKPVGGMQFADLLQQLDLPPGPQSSVTTVRTGGPVEGERGFVVHSDDYSSPISSMQIAPGLAMTATLDVIEDIAIGDGPDRALVMLGYCGWGAGQLEGEIAQNGWLLGPSDCDLIFAEDDAAKWNGALKAQGIDALSLSSSAGTA